MVNVLVTGCGGAIGQCAIKGLRLETNGFCIIGVDSDPYSAFLHTKYDDVSCDKSYVIPAADEQNFIPVLLELCQKENVDIILPCTDSELEKLSLNKTKFLDAGSKVIVSPPETIKVCRDKWLTFERLQSFVPIVKSALPNLGVEKALELTGTPAIIKPRLGWGSRCVHEVNSVKEAEVLAGSIDKPVIQQFLKGEEYTVDCLTDKNGKFLCGVPRIRKRIFGGISFQGLTVQDNELIMLGEKIANHLRIIGPFNFQLIKNDREVGIFEINARLAGTSILSANAGINFPLLSVKDMCGIKLPAKFDFEGGLILSRFFDEIYFKKKKEAKVKAVLFDLDDTLYNEKQFVCSGFQAVSRHMADKYGFNGSNFYSMLLEIFQSQGRKNVFDLALNKLGAYRSDLVDEMVTVYRTHFPNIILPSDNKQVLAQISKSFLTGLVTGGIKEVQKNKIEALGIDEFFDIIVYASELGGKQNTRVYITALQKLGVKASEAIYVDDNIDQELSAPKKLGIVTVKLLKSNNAFRIRTPPFIADYEIEDLTDLLDVIGLAKENMDRPAQLEKKPTLSSVKLKNLQATADQNYASIGEKERTIVISQPTYLPWAGYFRIMKEADIFVFLDNVQFESRSWQCRNRIKGPAKWQWLSVPVRHKGECTITEVEIDNSKPWRRKHWQAIKSCYGKARFFDVYSPFFKSVYEAEWEKIAQLNIHMTKYLASQLGISPIFLQASKLNAGGKRTHLLFEICKMLNADRYLSSIGAKEYMDNDGAEKIFERGNIKIEFLNYNSLVYPQLFGEFVPDLSIIDLLFNCGPDSSKILFDKKATTFQKIGKCSVA